MATEPNIIVSLLEGMNATRWGLLGLGLFGLELITGLPISCGRQRRL